MITPANRLGVGWRMWVPSTVLMLSSLLSYVDRQVLAVLSPTILHDTGLSSAAYTDALSAFSIAYMVANPLWGSVLDFVGLRTGMLMAVAIWTVASVSHAWVAGFLGFAVARAILGFGEGATFPGGLRTATDWLPAKQQSRGIALAYSGGSLGAIITPLMVTPVALAYGWRTAFIVTGTAGLAWVLGWRTTVDFSPEAQDRRTDRIMLPNPFERRFWSLVAAYGLGALPIGIIIYLAPLYLSKVLAFTQGELGRVLWLPPLGWEIGYFFWGWFTDRFAAGNARPSWILFSLAILGLPLV